MLLKHCKTLNMKRIEGKMTKRSYRQYETNEAAEQAANALKNNGNEKVVVCGDDWTQVRYIKNNQNS